MKVRNLIDGMTLLCNYYIRTNGDCYAVSAEHDEIFMTVTDFPLQGEDLRKLIALGWHQEYEGRDYNRDFGENDYRHDEPWVAYV